MEFKRGTWKFNDDANFNFQMNRVVMWDGGDAEALMRVGHDIHNSADWVRAMTRLATEAEQAGQMEAAVGYLRMSEFFMYDDNPEKLSAYRHAAEMFAQVFAGYFDSGRMQRYEVPYGQGHLPVMAAKAHGATRNVVLLHGATTATMKSCSIPCCICPSGASTSICLQALARAACCGCRA